MKQLLTVFMLALLVACAKEKDSIENIALFTPSPGCTKAVSNELFFIHFKSDAEINPEEAITIFNEDGSVFEEIKLDGDCMLEKKSTRVIFNPKKDLEIGKKYYVNFSSNAFSDSSCVVSKTGWSFTCGQKLREVEKYCSGIEGNFRLLIGLPESYEQNTDKKYPVVYITDGGFFNHNQYGELADAAAKGKIADLITVGITYPEEYIISDIRKFRGRDLARYPDVLFNFLNDNIIPFINSEYRTQVDNNTLIGNSLGGMFTSGTLLRYRENSGFPFKNQFAVAQIADYVEAEQALADAVSDLPLNFYLGIGGADRPEWVQSYHTLISNLESRNYPSFQFKHKVYEGLPHGEVSSTPSFKDAFEWIFPRE